MSAAWTAGAVRARAMLHRRLGSAARDLAGCPDLPAALDMLLDGPYRRGLAPTDDLAAAERAIGDTLLWHLRVLAGWQPAAGAAMVRVLAAWFELANIVDHARMLDGAAPVVPYRLGALATAWPRLSGTVSWPELRAGLAASPWGDPGADSAAAVAITGLVSWAARVAGGVPQAADWAAGAVAILAARERFLRHNALPRTTVAHLTRLLGVDPTVPGSLGELTGAIRPPVRVALSGVDDPADLWGAEVAWWGRVRRDGESLVRRGGFGPDNAVGCAALLAVDAWRVGAALEVVALGHGMAVFDELV